MVTALLPAGLFYAEYAMTDAIYPVLVLAWLLTVHSWLTARSVRGQYAAAAGNFRRIVEASPSDDYAQFGLGLALARTGDPGAAAEHLALAAAMQPDLRHYADALRSVRATLRARAQQRADHPEDPQRDARDA